MRDDLPDFVVVNSHVVMYQNISETGNPAPGNFRMSITELDGKLLARFGQNLQISQDRVLDEPFRLISRQPRLGERLDMRNAFEHMDDEKLVTLHSRTASAST